MTDALANFTSAAAPVEYAETFYRRVAEVCTDAAEVAPDARDTEFLRFASASATEVAASLSLTRGEGRSPALERYLQYTPDQPVPGERELQALAALEGDAERTLDALCGDAARWIDLFRRMAQAPAVPVGPELYNSCADLLDAWCKRLSSAYQQQRDL